jgi:hypothetical protein
VQLHDLEEACVGHHAITEGTKVPAGTIARQTIDKLVTGPLLDPKTNYYNALHRAYNEAVRKIVVDMEAQLGKPLSEFTRKEVLQLARRILAAPDARIQNFLNSLSNTAAGQTARQALADAIAVIDAIGDSLMELSPIFCVNCNDDRPTT